MSLTPEELFDHLYGLINKIPPPLGHRLSSSKEAILPLILYKVISDTYRDRVEHLKEKVGHEVARDPSLHRFTVPEEYEWQKMRSCERDLDASLNEALRAIERANPDTFSRVFRTDYETERVLDVRALRNLIDHLSEHSLSLHRLPAETVVEALLQLCEKKEKRGNTPDLSSLLS